MPRIWMWKGKLPFADLSIAWSTSSRWNGSTVSLKATSLDDLKRDYPLFGAIAQMDLFFLRGM
jgi:hypothetical protein